MIEEVGGLSQPGETPVTSGGQRHMIRTTLGRYWPPTEDGRTYRAGGDLTTREVVIRASCQSREEVDQVGLFQEQEDGVKRC